MSSLIESSRSRRAGSRKDVDRVMAWKPIPSASVQYVGVTVVAKQAGVIVDPTGDVVRMAFMATTDLPLSGDFNLASWETNGSTTPPTYTALCLIGPGYVQLDPGEYRVFVQIVDSPEVPIIPTPEILVIL